MLEKSLNYSASVKCITAQHPRRRAPPTHSTQHPVTASDLTISVTDTEAIHVAKLKTSAGKFKRGSSAHRDIEFPVISVGKSSHLAQGVGVRLGQPERCLRIAFHRSSTMLLRVPEILRGSGSSIFMGLWVTPHRRARSLSAEYY